MAAAKKLGVPKHVPTAITREIVRSSTGFGVEQEFIAERLGISTKTLHRHYASEISQGVPDLIMRVAASLTRKATAKKLDHSGVVAGIYILKARGKREWMDNYSRVENVGADGAPLQNGGGNVVIMLPDNGRDPQLIATAGRNLKVLPSHAKQIEAEAVEVE